LSVFIPFNKTEGNQTFLFIGFRARTRGTLHLSAVTFTFHSPHGNKIYVTEAATVITGNRHNTSSHPSAIKGRIVIRLKTRHFLWQHSFLCQSDVPSFFPINKRKAFNEARQCQEILKSN
jgi:hypothetical protein